MCDCIYNLVIIGVILLFLKKCVEFCKIKSLETKQIELQKIKIEKEINDLKVKIEYEQDDKKEKFLKNEKNFLEKKLKLLENPNKCCIYLP